MELNKNLNCRNQGKNIWEPARLVLNKPGETQPPPAEAAPSAPPASPQAGAGAERPPAGENPAARAERERREAEARKGDEARLAELDAALAKLEGGQAPETDGEKPLSRQLTELFTEAYKRNKDDVLKLFTETEKRNIPAHFEKFASAVLTSLNAEEQKHLSPRMKIFLNFNAAGFENQFFRTDGLNYAAIAQKLKDGQVSINESFVLALVMQESDLAELQKLGVEQSVLDTLKALIALSKTLKEEATKEATPQQEGTEQKGEEAGETLPRPPEADLNAAYEKIFDTPDLKQAYFDLLDRKITPDQFLEKITDPREKEAVRWTLDPRTPVTEEEKAAMREHYKDSTLPKDEAEIIAFAKRERLDYHQLQTLRVLINGDKEQTDRNRAAMERAAKGGSIMVVLEKFFEKLTALFEKLGVQLEKFTGQMDAARAGKFEKSPIGGDKKVTILKKEPKEPGVLMVKAEKPGEDVTAMTGGKVEKVENGSVTIKTEKGDTIQYSGFKNLAFTKDATIAAGDKLGTLESDQLTIVLRDKDGKPKENPETLLLASYITESPEAAPAAQAEYPVMDVKQSPLGRDRKLTAEKLRGNEGLKIRAHKDDPIYLFAKGKITGVKRDEGAVTVRYKDQIVVYKGIVVADNLQEGPDEVQLNKSIGKVGDSKNFTIQFFDTADKPLESDKVVTALATYLPSRRTATA